ncbi:hypothetical protein [Microbacterium resistens]|uniref:hypothetical protein n=1 Tax=Microbacterium resistens TaxID=156977 RepID=UPI000A41A7A8|nr:hypothetical protein [Microbacterium resistens]
MEAERENPDAADSTRAETARSRPLTEDEALRKDMSYSPGSETETAQKQRDPLPGTVDPDIPEEDVRAVPGTGGPDDTGDVDVDPDELDLPGAPVDGREPD